MTHSGGSRELTVATLARVEGEGSLHVAVRDGLVTDVQLRIFEPPRFFEAFLRGRGYMEPPDITARICGICPVAYQMSACQAIEQACGVTVDGQLQALRRLLYCGEWIESHTLHIYMLHAPDFLGYDSSIALAADHRDIVARGLQLKKIGNDIVSMIGGRAIHPVNVRIGGFYRLPSPETLRDLAERLRWARTAAVETARWVATFNFPDVELDGDLVALRHQSEYPMNDGRIASTGGLDIAVAEYSDNFLEEHSAHSTALRGRGPGPQPHTMARWRATASTSSTSPPWLAGLPRRPVWALPAETPFAVSSFAPSRWCTPATRLCGSSSHTCRPHTPISMCRRGPAPAMDAPRHRGVRSTIATRSTRRGRSPTPSSCRPPRRTRHRSSTGSGGSCRTVFTSTTPR